MFRNKKIKFVLPDLIYSKSYLEAAEEFAEENKINKNFLVAKMSQNERLALSSGTLDFHKNVVIPCQTPFGEDKKVFVYWIIMDNTYIGEVYIKDKLLEKSFVKNLAHPQYKWNEIYKDDIKRYTTSCIIIRPSARNPNNLAIIMCLLHEKLEELGFDEFVINCYKTDRVLNYKLCKMRCICEGIHYETTKTIEYIIPVRPEIMKKVVEEKFINDFINTKQSFESFLLGLKEHISEVDNSKKDKYLINSTDTKRYLESFLLNIKDTVSNKEDNVVMYN